MRRIFVLPLAATLFAAPVMLAGARPQEPAPLPTTAPPAQTPTPAKHVHAAPTNLQVLPKTLTGEQVHELMEQWEQQTGMHCSGCHTADPKNIGPNGKPRLNFADDSKKEKHLARLMYQMTKDLNEKYLTQSPDFGDHVECGTCHRGHQQPQAFVAPPEEHDHDHPAMPAPAMK